MGHFQDDQEIEWHAARSRHTVADSLREEVARLTAEVARLRGEIAAAAVENEAARSLAAKALAKANDPTWGGYGPDGDG